MAGASLLFTPMVTVLNPCLKPSVFRPALAGLLLACCLQAQANEPLTITIARGDTLIKLCERYLREPGQWPQIKRLNRIAKDTRLQPGSSLRIPFALLRWTERSAEVVHVQGVVTGLLSGTTSLLSPGLQLKAGDKFDTGTAGTLTLRLPDGATVVFPPRTQAGLGVSREVSGTAVRATAIDLQTGAADSTVPSLKDPASRFEIRTPRVVTAVRGTRFRVAAEGDTSHHEVLSGVVAVDGTSGHASLQPAQGLRADGGQLGAVVPLLPAADVSALPQRIERIAQNLTLPPLADAVAWRWQVAEDAGFVRLLQDARTAEPSWLLQGLPDGDYFVRVGAIDAQGLEGLEAQKAFALRARPEPPVLTSPGPDASVARPSALVWTQLGKAPAYRVQVARDGQFTDLLVDRADAQGDNNNRLEMDPAWGPGTYHWRVATLRPDGSHGPFGDPGSFTVLAPSVMAAPAVSENSVQLAWSGPAGFRHRVQVAPTDDFAQPEYDEQVPGARLDLPTPAAGVHFVRTQVVLPDGSAGSWSDAQHFEVPRKPQYGWWLLLLLAPAL